MTLPEFADLSSEVVNALLSQHGLASQPAVRLPDVGIFNAIFAIGETIILRIPRNHPAFVEAARKEAVAVPFARRAGVRTPDLLIFDDSLDLLPVPYSFYKRVQGATLELLKLEPEATQAAYFELGRDLALLHQGVPFIEPARSLALEGLSEPEALPDELAAEGYIGTSEAQWLSHWLVHLRSLCSSKVLCFDMVMSRRLT